VFTPREARVSFLTAVYGFGASLIGIGIISLILFYWRDIPSWVKVATPFALTAILYGGGAYAGRAGLKRPNLGHTLVVLGTLSLGISLFAWVEIYQLPILARSWYWILACVALGVAYLVANPVNTVVAAGAAGLVFGMESDYRAGLDLWWFPFLASAAFFALAYWRESRVAFVSALVVTGGTTHFVTVAGGQFQHAVLATAAICLFAFACTLLSSSQERWRGFATWSIPLAVAYLAAWLALLSYREAYWNYIGNASAPAGDAGIMRFIPIGIMCVVTAFMWCEVVRRDFALPAIRSLSKIYLTCCALFVASQAFVLLMLSRFGGSTPILPMVFYVCVNLAAILLGAGVAWAGVALLDRRIFWIAVVYLGVLVAWRSLETDINLLARSMVLIGSGIAVIAGGVWFESILKTRKLI
jgi:uncharacterized membrane protein